MSAMHAYLITGDNDLVRDEKIEEICQKYSISSFDIVTIKSEGPSLGIDDIKKMQEKAFLKPLKGSHKTVVIKGAEMLTIPAQNALLKILEEPPQNTIMILASTTAYDLLPTILSRVSLVRISKKEQKMTEDEKKEVAKKLLGWKKQSIANALKTAEIMAKDKEKTLQVLEESLYVGREILREEIASEKEPQLSKMLPEIQKKYQILKYTNANPRLTLEDLFLTLINL